MPNDKIYLNLASRVMKSAGKGKSPILPVPEGAVRIAYGTKCHENIDIYYPQNAENADIIFAIHGGGWMEGDTTMLAPQCLEAAEHGYIAVSFDYEKITDGALCSDMLNQITNALTTLKKELSAIGNEKQRVVIAGHSAGPQLALCYAYSRADECPYEIAFVVSNSAPSDFLHKSSGKKPDIEKGTNIVLTSLTGKAVTKKTLVRENVKQAVKSVNAISLVTKNSPPTLIVHGDKDSMISLDCSVLLHKKLCESGVDTTLVIYKGADHFLKNNPEGVRARAEAFRELEKKYL